MRLEDWVRGYVPDCPQEAGDRGLMLEALKGLPGCLFRSSLLYHFTASAWVVNPGRTRVLMVFHRLYRSWSWTGGHADGEEDLFSVALRELAEETGLTGPVPLLGERVYSLECLTVDGHEKGGAWVPSHLHLNLTWLFEGDDRTPLREKPDENSGVRWIPLQGVNAAVSERWMWERVNRKLLKKLERVP